MRYQRLGRPRVFSEEERISRYHKQAGCVLQFLRGRGMEGAISGASLRQIAAHLYGKAGDRATAEKIAGLFGSTDKAMIDKVAGVLAEADVKEHEENNAKFAIQQLEKAGLAGKLYNTWGGGWVDLRAWDRWEAEGWLNDNAEKWNFDKWSSSTETDRLKYCRERLASLKARVQSGNEEAIRIRRGLKNLGAYDSAMPQDAEQERERRADEQEVFRRRHGYVDEDSW